MATGNTCKKFSKIWMMRGLRDMRLDRQTDKHTDMLTTVLYTLQFCTTYWRSKVITRGSATAEGLHDASCSQICTTFHEV